MKRAVIMLFQLLVTAAGLWYVFHEPQRRAQIADALRHADIRWVLLGWICYSAVEILATVRWQILLRIQGICISWLRAGAIVIVGLFFNQFLPGGVGGDAMRLYFIFRQAPRQKIAATLSIAMDRLFGLLTVVFLASVSFSLRFSWLAGSGPSRHIAYIAFILLSASLAFVLLLFWLSKLRPFAATAETDSIARGNHPMRGSPAVLSHARCGDGLRFPNHGSCPSRILHKLLLCRRITAPLNLRSRQPRRHSLDHAARGHDHLGAHLPWRPRCARDPFSRTAWQSRAWPPALAAFTASLGFAVQACWGLVGAAVFLASQKIINR